MASEPKNLAEALIAFQASVPTIHEKQLSFTASLPTLLEFFQRSIQPFALLAWLSCNSLCTTENGTPALRTTIRHTNGEQDSAVTPLAIAGGKNVHAGMGKGCHLYPRTPSSPSWGSAGIEDNDADASASTSAPTPAQQQQKPVKKAAAKPVQTPVKQDPEPVSDPEGPLSPELQKELVDGTIPALPGDYVETFCKAFAVQFKTGNKKIRNCFTHYKHYTWTQDYFAKHPLPAVQS